MYQGKWFTNLCLRYQYTARCLLASDSRKWNLFLIEFMFDCPVIDQLIFFSLTSFKISPKHLHFSVFFLVTSFTRWTIVTIISNRIPKFIIFNDTLVSIIFNDAWVSFLYNDTWVSFVFSNTWVSIISNDTWVSFIFSGTLVSIIF